MSGAGSVILSPDKLWLEEISPQIKNFLSATLKFELHPDKVFIKTLASGVDFLGWVHFPNHQVLRTTTRRRMLKCIAGHPTEKTLQSYLGLLRHGDTYYWQQYIFEQLTEN